MLDYLSGALEILLVEVKVSAESSDSEERSEESCFSSSHGQTVRTLLMLNLQLRQRSVITVKTRPHKLIVTGHFIHYRTQTTNTVLDNLQREHHYINIHLCHITRFSHLARCCVRVHVTYSHAVF